MVIKFLNFCDEIRNKIENDVENIYNIYPQKNAEKKILEYFKNIKYQNYEFYAQLIGFLISDYYKILYEKQKFDGLNSKEKNYFKMFNDIFDNNDLVLLIEDIPGILLDLIYQMSEYNYLDFFSKREILISCKDNIELLKKYSVLNIYDYLYYCQKYTPEILKNIFNEQLIKGDNKEDIYLSITCTLEELMLMDKENYYELISNLLIEYYNIGKYEIFNYKKPVRINILIKTINFLENNNQKQIIKKFNEITDDEKDNNFIYEVLHRFFNFKKENIKLENKDKKYNDTIKKLKLIKEYGKISKK